MIEITRTDGAYIYRIAPTDPLVIERKPNQHGARWYWYLRRDTVGETKRALLNMPLVAAVPSGKGEGEE